MIVTEQQKPIVEHTFSVGRFACYPNIIVGEFNEGMHVTKDAIAEPIRMVQELYGTENPFVYISHRRHSYSMDPVGYKEIAGMFPNFIGFAIVSNNRYRRVLANLEKLFIKKPIRVFYRMDKAFEWAQSLVDSKA